MTDTMTSTYTLYSTTTCGRCPVARRALTKAGVKWREVKLDEPGNEFLTESIKDETNAKNLEVPMVRTPAGHLLRNLAFISEHFQGLENA